MKLGIDLGGTKIEAIVLDNDGAEVWRHRVATPQGDYEGALSAISSLVELAKNMFGVNRFGSIGVGTPGALTSIKGVPDPVMKNCNSTALNGQPLLKDLSKTLGCEVFIANDANCFALAETLSGQGSKIFGDKTVESVFGVILGTGVGGGLVVRGELLQGKHSITGEWGHNCLPASCLSVLDAVQKQRACYCGRTDCIETYLSGPGLALSYKLRYQEDLSPEQIILNMREGEERATAIWQQYLSQLACSLSQVVNIIDPSLIVLGGGLSMIPEIYGAIHQMMAPHVFSNDFETPILPAELGDSAGVFGAAWLNPRLNR